MPAFQIKDNQGRILLQSKGDRYLLSRYPNLDKETKEELAAFFAEATGRGIEEIRSFLDYKSEVQELCS